MPFLTLIAASPSFIKQDMLTERIVKLKQRRPDAEIHCITQKHFTKMLTQQGNVQVHARDFAAWAGAATTKVYEAIYDRMDAAIIFWDGESKPEQNLIRMCKERPLQHEVILFESLKQEIDRLREEGKVEKRKKITVPLTSDQKQRYIEAHINYTKHRAAVKDFGYVKPKILPINSGSRMAYFIVNFLLWSGHNATQITTAGRQINGVYIPTTTAKGTADVSATINGKSVKIEVKHVSDKPSAEQLKQQERERRSGGVYEFVYSIQQFFSLYDSILVNCQSA